MPETDAIRCPACEGGPTASKWEGLPDRLFRTTDRTFALRSCSRCHSLFLWPVPSLEELERFYPEGYWVGPEGDSNGHTSLMERYRRFVLRDHLRFVGRVVDGQKRRGLAVRVLDVGCGDGSFLQALGESDCVGLDYSLSALRACRARGLCAVRGQPGAPPFRAGTFSLITMFHFLEHVSPPDPVLAAVRDLLAPDGDLVVQVPNRDSLQARALGRRWIGYDVPRHLVDFSADSLRGTLGRCGFEIVAENHFCLRDNPTAFAFSLVPGLYPPARIARGGARTGARAMIADLAYFGLTMLCTPFAFLESALGRGASVMVHARAKQG